MNRSQEVRHEYDPAALQAFEGRILRAAWVSGVAFLTAKQIALAGKRKREKFVPAP